MPDIMIRCPKLRTVVPTGLTTETVKFESIPNIAIPFRCPACQKTHKWRPGDAWVDKRRPRQRVQLIVRKGG